MSPFKSKSYLRKNNTVDVPVPERTEHHKIQFTSLSSHGSFDAFETPLSSSVASSHKFSPKRVVNEAADSTEDQHMQPPTSNNIPSNPVLDSDETSSVGSGVTGTEGNDTANSDLGPSVTTPEQGQRNAEPIDPFGDRERTKLRYKTAAKQLEEALKHARGIWETFEIPSFDVPQFDSADNCDRDPLRFLQSEIKKVLEARKGSSKGYIERVFTTVSPLAKNFLRIAMEGQSVRTSRDPSAEYLQIPVLNPYGLLCGGLVLLITVQYPYHHFPDRTDCRS